MVQRFLRDRLSARFRLAGLGTLCLNFGDKSKIRFLTALTRTKAVPFSTRSPYPESDPQSPRHANAHMPKAFHQILGADAGSGQQGLLAGAQTPGLLENPSGHPGPNDAGFTAAIIRPRIDVWQISFPNYPLEKFRFLPTRRYRQHFLEIVQGRDGMP